MFEKENFEKNFEKIEEKDLREKNFENCKFSKITIIGGSLSSSSFTDCVFDECNLTMSDVSNTKFQDVQFRNSKIVGINFSQINKFVCSPYFDNCILKHCNFSNLPLKKSKFIKCDLEGCDFMETQLNETNFKNSSFRDCFFQNANLRATKFNGATGFIINPSTNNVFDAEFDYPGVLGLVKDFGIKLK